jgi:hypothetical protein
MQRVTSILFFALASLALAACGSSSGGDGTEGSGASTGSGGHTTAGTGATSSSSGSGTCSGDTPVELTVLNYLSWCDVTVAGGASSSAATIKTCVADGTVTLTQKAESSAFQLGDWYGVSGDTGKGTPGTVAGSTSTATISVSGSSACVSVCCPFTGGSGCPGKNECPGG